MLVKLQSDIQEFKGIVFRRGHDALVELREPTSLSGEFADFTSIMKNPGVEKVQVDEIVKGRMKAGRGAVPTIIHMELVL